MSWKASVILAILVVHLVIYVVQRVARGFLGSDRQVEIGIYLVLLPVGLNCSCLDVPAPLIAAMVLTGLVLMLRGIGRARSGRSLA